MPVICRRPQGHSSAFIRPLASTCWTALAYAVEQGWLVISGGLHSVSLTEAGRRRVESR